MSFAWRGVTFPHQGGGVAKSSPPHFFISNLPIMCKAAAEVEAAEVEAAVVEAAEGEVEAVEVAVEATVAAAMETATAQSGAD